MFMSFKIRDTKNKANARYKTIYLSLDTIKKIDAIAAENNTSFNNIVVSMIEYCLEDEANKNSAKESLLRSPLSKTIRGTYASPRPQEGVIPARRTRYMEQFFICTTPNATSKAVIPSSFTSYLS